MFDLERARRAIAEEGLSGWLFLNLQHRDAVSDRILGVPSGIHNTRPWLYLVPREGEPVRLVHAVEERILDSLPGRKAVYASRAAFTGALRGLALPGRTAAQFSPDLPVLSFLDHGSARLLAASGFRLVSSAALIQRFLGLLSPQDLDRHEEAARILYSIIEQVWERVRPGLTEGEVQGWILDLFRRNGLETGYPPLVAVGRHTADPHYEPEAAGATFRPGEVVQLDIWARHPGDGVYADISWVGFLGREPDPEVQRAFDHLVAARERAVRFIERGLRRKAGLRGLEVDREVRRVLEEAGYGRALKHRTGHAIDVELHGYGVNLDATEFPDARRILEGSCFSIEPGLYLDRFGLRTEINAYVRDGRLVVSGGVPQRRILCVY